MDTKPFFVTDPREWAFLRVVRSLPPEAKADLTEAMRLTVEQHRPVHETRAAWLKFFQHAGYPRAEWRWMADQIMTSGIAALVRNK